MYTLVRYVRRKRKRPRGSIKQLLEPDIPQGASGVAIGRDRTKPKGVAQTPLLLPLVECCCPIGIPQPQIHTQHGERKRDDRGQMLEYQAFLPSRVDPTR